LRNWLGIAPVEAQPPNLPYEDCLSLDFLFTETKEMLLRQLDRVEALDNKAGLLSGFDGVIITAAAGFLIDTDPITPSARWVSWSPLALTGAIVVGLGAVLMSFVFAAKALRVRSYQEVVNPKTAYDQWIYWHERCSKMQLRANLVDSYEKNERFLDKKAGAIKTATWSLLIGIVLFSVSAVGCFVITI
jgi:hypothetical protein